MPHILEHIMMNRMLQWQMKLSMVIYLLALQVKIKVVYILHIGQKAVFHVQNIGMNLFLFQWSM